MRSLLIDPATNQVYLGSTSGVFRLETDGSVTTLGSGDNGNDVYAMALHAASNSLLVGGTFSSIGGVSASRFAVWSGTAWSARASYGNTVFTITTNGANAYVGGAFTTPYAGLAVLSA